MTNPPPSPLDDLAGRVERATGPDPQLDEMIFKAVDGDGRDNHTAAPIYTASLDAAMTLVPEGRIVTIGGGLNIGTAVIADEDGGNCIGSKAATPALALTAASLRARGDRHG